MFFVEVTTRKLSYAGRGARTGFNDFQFFDGFKQRGRAARRQRDFSSTAIRKIENH